MLNNSGGKLARAVILIDQLTGMRDLRRGGVGRVTNFTPRALAVSCPRLVRSVINERSNSAHVASSEVAQHQAQLRAIALRLVEFFRK